MNPQVSGGAMDESKETASTQQSPTSLGKEILSLMKGDAPEDSAFEAQPATKTTETTETAETEKVTSQETAIAATEETETETATQQEPPKGETWPDSAKKRVAEESDKRRRAIERAAQVERERDEWEQRARDLHARLQEASGPRPTSRDPLADVWDANSLKRATIHYKNLLATATTALDENPTEAEIDVVIGKDEKGEAITKTFKRKELSEMKQISEQALNHDLPDRKTLIESREKFNAVAVQVYPAFGENEGDNDWIRAGQEILSAVPELQRIPDCWIWIGHALEGRRLTLERIKKNGDGKAEKKTSANPIVEQLRTAPKIKAPPEISTTRVPSQSTVKVGADIEAARKKMKETGSDEAMEDFVGAVLTKGASRGYERVS